MKRRDILKGATHLGAAATFAALGGNMLYPRATMAGTKPAPGRWPFGLTRSEERRAEKLHRDSIVFDMLYLGSGGANIFDEYDPALLAQYLDKSLHGPAAVERASFIPYQMALDGKSDLVKKWWQMSGVTVGPQTISPAYPSKELDESRKEANRFFDLPWTRFVTTARQMREAKRDGVYACYGHCQPVGGIPPDLSTIDDAYKAGLRQLMLTYNRMDYVGGGCTERIDVGLSSYGLEVVQRCNELGILVDTSHCSKQTTLDACKFSKAPVLANHTSAKGLYNHARGKSDEELHAVAQTGGVIGLVTVPAFLSSQAHPTIEVFLDHVDYVVKKVGWQQVGIGTDWPMELPRAVAKGDWQPWISKIGFRPEDGLSGELTTLAGYEDGRDFPNITRGLVKRGYSDEQIRGILGENFVRVFERVCG